LIFWIGVAVAADLVVVGDVFENGKREHVAVEVQDGVISKVYRGKKVNRAKGQRILDGDLLIAGLVDAHGHPTGLGWKLANVDLTGIATYAETLDRVNSTRLANDWVMGRGWDQNDWADAPKGSWPTAEDLDRVTEGPAAFRRVDGHAVWVNSAAIKAAGVTADTQDPAGGQIIRDAQGQPIGVFIDEAMSLIPTPTPTPERRRILLQAAFDEMLQHGLIGAHDMGVGDETLAIYEDLAAKGELPVRIWAYLAPDEDGAKRLLETGPWQIGRLHVVGIKTFADGAMGSRGALLRDDYSDQPGHRGSVITPVEELTELATSLVAVDAQLAVHAIGDQAVSHVLDAFAAARIAHPERNTPLRIEHAQVVHPDDLPRFLEVKAVASMQPTHYTSDIPWAPDRLGPERIDWAYAWRSMLELGVPLVLGSDFPVESVDPMEGLWSAMTRLAKSEAGKSQSYGSEVLTLEEAVHGFSRGPADLVGYAGGRLEVGAPADFTLLSEQPLPAGHHYWPTATVVGGVLAWEP
jgi:predicted amidohydrolase YtcJ